VIQTVEPARTVLLREGEDRIEVVSPRGDASVQIVFGPDGPIVTLTAPRVELRAEDLRIRCKNLDVAADEEIKLRSRGDLHVNGAIVRLNCDDESTGRSPTS
jgi:hypothetical protein